MCHSTLETYNGVSKQLSHQVSLIAGDTIAHE